MPIEHKINSRAHLIGNDSKIRADLRHTVHWLSVPLNSRTDVQSPIEDNPLKKTTQFRQILNSGELEFLQVLIVRRSYYESSIRLIQAKGSLAQSASKIDGLLLTGGLDSPTDYTDGDGIRGASFGWQ